jgi:hypothetical protein
MIERITIFSFPSSSSVLPAYPVSQPELQVGIVLHGFASAERLSTSDRTLEGNYHITHQQIGRKFVRQYKVL